MQPYSAREDPNLLSGIFKYHLETGYSKWHQQTALIHHDRFKASVNQLCIDCFTLDFLHAQSDVTGGCECMCICAWLLCLLCYCYQTLCALPIGERSLLHKSLQHVYASTVYASVCNVYASVAKQIYLCPYRLPACW